jgi:hypothetical protein
VGSPAAIASDDAVVVRAAAVLGLVWLGDALIYVVLPLHAAAFGIGLGLVGVALSLNRIVRIVGYAWVAYLHRRLGLRALTASAAARGRRRALARRGAADRSPRRRASARAVRGGRRGRPSGR